MSKLELIESIRREVTKRVAEGQFKSPEIAARAIVELETQFPTVEFSNLPSGVHFKIITPKRLPQRVEIKFDK